MLRVIRALWEDRSGPTAIEYGLIAGLIAIAIIAGLTSVGTTLNTEETKIAAKLSSA
jgi:pilus assembly protein Flp/PilA